MSKRLNDVVDRVQPDNYGLDNNTLGKTKYSKYDWHWRFDYYQIPNDDINDYLGNTDIASAFKSYDNNKLLKRHYQHTADFNINTDIEPVSMEMDTGTANNLLITYKIQTGYTQSESTNNDFEHSIPIDVNQINQNHTNGIRYILLHMHTNIEFKESITFKSRSSNFNLTANNRLIIVSGNNEYWNTTEDLYTPLISAIDVNSTSVRTLNQVGTTNPFPEKEKEFTFNKGWNSIDCYIVIDKNKLNKYKFSLSLNPTIQYHNPNIKVNNQFYVDVINANSTINLDDYEDFTTNNKKIDYNEKSIAKDYVNHISPDVISNQSSTEIRVRAPFSNDQYIFQQIEREYNGYEQTQTVFYHIGDQINTKNFKNNKISIDQILLRNNNHNDLDISSGAYLHIYFSQTETTSIDDYSTNKQIIELISPSMKQTIKYHNTLMINRDTIDIDATVDNPIIRMKLVDISTNNIFDNSDIEVDIYYSYKPDNTNNTKNESYLELRNTLDQGERSKITILHDGSVGIGTTDTHKFSLFVNNISAEKRGIYCADDITILSDRRYKKDIEPINSKSALDIVKQLEGVRYKRCVPNLEQDQDKNIDKQRSPVIGFIAQDIQRVLPEVVRGEEDSELGLSVSYARLIPILVEAIKELAK